MASLTGLNSGEFTDIDVVDTISINGDAGSLNQVLTSDGTLTSYQDTLEPAAADIVQAGTGISLTTGGNPETISTNVKSLVLSGTGVTSSPQTFNPNANGGSQTITINDTNTTYSAGDGLDLTGTTFSADLKSGSGLVITSTEIDLEDIPNSALEESTITIGSTAIALGATSTIVAGLTGLTFLGSPSATTLTGNNYTDTQTTTTYLDLTSATNVFPTLYPNYVSPYLSHTSYDPSSSTAKSLSTSYSTMYSPYLLTTFVARGASVEVQIQTYNYAISSNRWLYLRLVDDDDAEWSGGEESDGGGKGTSTRTTERTIHYSDETDKQPINFTWVLTGLSAGTTYKVNPQAKTNSTTNYLYAGGSYAPNIIKIVQC